MDNSVPLLASLAPPALIPGLVPGSVFRAALFLFFFLLSAGACFGWGGVKPTWETRSDPFFLL
jgi:hypothetical protein